MEIRHQLPAYSPLPARASLAATAQLLGIGDDPRPRLRELVRREYDASAVVLCGSGTQALTIAMRTAVSRGESGAPVALPAFSCLDVATAAIAAGVRVSFYDLDPNTLAPDHESLERVLRAGAGVVVVAPLYGVPVDWDALSALVERYGAISIEDAAQGAGAAWRGRRLGSIGAIATLSFGRGKGWTGGHGGALLMKSDGASRGAEPVAPGFSNEAGTAFGLIAQWALGRPSVYGIPRSIPGLHLGETVYRTPKPETSLSRAAAAALLATHEASDREAEVRKSNAAQLLAAIADNPQLVPVSIDRLATAGYLRLPLRLAGGIAAFESSSIALAHGVAPSYPSSLADFPQLASRQEGPDRAWPGARTLVRDLVTLPTHSLLRPGELAWLSQMLRSVGRATAIDSRPTWERA